MREEYGRKSRQSAGGGTRGSHSKRSIFRRTVFLMAVCGVLMFIPLFWKLWNIALSTMTTTSSWPPSSRRWTCLYPPAGGTFTTETATCWPCQPQYTT